MCAKVWNKKIVHRFFLLDAPLQTGHSVDLAPIGRQLRNVLRLHVGERIVLLDGKGAAYGAEITMLDRQTATGVVLEPQTSASEPSVHLTLYQCSLKADKFEWVLQKGTELGVSTFVPVISARSVVRPAAALLKKYERWRLIVQEAAEQSGRTRLPQLHAPLDWRDAVQHARGARYMPWEERIGEMGAPGLGVAIEDAWRQLDSLPSVNLLIGPEGGIEAAEAAEAIRLGWQIAALGPRILRAETAALAAVTIVMERLRQLS